MMRFLLLLTLWMETPTTIWAQTQCDSTLVRLILSDTSAYRKHRIRIPLIWDEQAKQAGNALKIGNELYYLPDQFGAVFHARLVGDSLNIERIDTTIHSGYNGGQYCFYTNNKLYGFGGYGTWRSNGQLRVYVSDRMEWDIVKLNMDIPSLNYFTWFDPKAKKLWCARQDEINEVLTNDNHKTSFVTYALDINSSQWGSYGNLNFKPSNTEVLESQILCETPNGPMVFSQGPSYLIYDFAANKTYTLGKTSDSLTLHYFPKAYTASKSLVFINGRFIVYDHLEKKIVWEHPFASSEMTLSTETVYQKPLSSELKILLFAALSGLFYLFVWLLRKNLVNKMEVEQQEISTTSTEETPVEENIVMPVQASSIAPTEESVNGHKANQNGQQCFHDNLSPLELEVYQHIKANTTNNVGTRTEMLNHILGTERKNIDIQKKQRSDILLSINDKYKLYFRTNESLIIKKRLDEDKRLYEYFINKEALALV